jgi:murein peptide amidase A
MNEIISNRIDILVMRIIVGHMLTVSEAEPVLRGFRPGGPARRSMPELLAPLERIAASAPSLIANHGASFEVGGQTYELPRYLYLGPKGGGDTLRIGLFAGVHGDEPEGVHALVQFLTLLDREPELAKGYALFVYPICNPTGFEDRTRHARSGKDPNREFWRGSTEPEIRLLESELVAHSFHGIISLHTDDTSHGFYGFAHGATLTHNLIEPALDAAEEFLARNADDTIDGFEARNGIIHQGYQGILRAPPAVRPRPFEIILETPQAAPSHLKEAAFVAALRVILARYRELIAFAPNL